MGLDYSVIGSRIKRCRLEKGYTQEQVAEKINISVAFLSRVECGSSHINLKRLNQICSILGVSEGYILNGSSKAPNLYLNDEFNTLLKDCPTEKIKLVYNVAKLIVEN